MSKVVLGTIALGLNGAVIAGGGWLIHTGLQKGKVDAELVDSLASFKNSVKDEGCVQELFPGLKDLNVPTGATAATLDANFLNTSSGKPKPRGCLVVNWDKKSKKGTGETVEKWSGTLRLLWAVKGEDKGFLMFLAGTTGGDSEKKIKWEGTVNALGTVDGVWKVNKQKEVKSEGNKSFNKDAEEGKFPSPDTVLNGVKGSKFWGMFGDKNELDKVGTVADSEKVESLYRGYWEWVGRDGTDGSELKGWTKELDKWWDDIFTKSEWDITTVVQNRKGVWTEMVSEEKTKGRDTTAENS